MWRLKFLVPLLLAPVAPVTPAVAPLPPEPSPTRSTEAVLPDIDAMIESALRRFDVPGVSVAVVKDGKVVLSRGYGVRDIASGEPMTHDTIVPILSISKQFTSFAAGLLADEKRLMFNLPIATYFPQFKTSDPEATATVTLRDLLSHRSGIPELTFLERDVSLTREQAVERLPHLTGFTSPRSTWSYSNYGYAIASRIIERAADKRFEDFVEDRVFKPLGMIRSTYSYDIAAGDPNRLSPVVVQSGKDVSLPLPHQSNLTAAAGGIYSTADDMAKWMLLQLSAGELNQGELIKPQTLSYLHQPAYAFGPGSRAPDVVRVGYALGWYNEVFRGYPLIRHGGYAPGVNTEVELLPQKRLGVAVFTNHDLPPFTEALAKALLDRLLGVSSRDWLAEGLKSENVIKASLVSSRKSAERSRVSGTRMSHKLSEYEGTYNHPGYGDVHVRSQGGRLSVEWATYQTPLAHWHYDVFRTTTSDESSVWAPRGSTAEIRFSTDFAGSVSALEIGGLTGVSGVTFVKQLAR